MSDTPEHWAHVPEKGGHFGLTLLVNSYRRGGSLLFRALLHIAIIWYWLFAHRARAASVDYLRRVHAYAGTTSPFARRPGPIQSYSHLLAFGRGVIDKIAGWMGEIPPQALVIHGLEHLSAVRNQGALLVGSHFGNLELLRAIKSDQPQPVTALVHTRHAEMFNRFLHEANPKAAMQLMQVTELGADGAMALQAKIEAGEWLVIAGDRTPVQSARVQYTDFLGAQAAFPEGPWILASLLKCPVLLVFCYRIGTRYEVHITPFRERIRLPRGAREAALQDTITDYAQHLQAHCLQAPYQWFNFYDFWAESE